MGQRYQLPDGRVVEALPQGGYQVVSGGASPVTGGNPRLPGEIAGQALNNQRTMQEIRQAQATATATTAKTRAESQSAQIKAKTDQEAYDAAHPKGTGATVIGPDSLKSLSVPDQELVKALAEGRLAFPGGFALKAPWWQQKLEQVAQYDPTFDATNFNNRAKARASLISGKVGTSANALNTAIGHVGLLNDQISGTASHSFTPINTIENAFDQYALGQSGITNYKDTAGKLASEETSVYRNGGGAEADVERYLKSFNPNAADKQKRDVVRNTLDLFASKQAANLYQYNLSSGGKPQVDLLDPAARKVLDQFPDIRDKYFSTPAAPLSRDAAALIQANGGTPPPSGPSAPPLGDGPPPVRPMGGVPRADYSGMTGGPQSNLAATDPNSKLGAFKQTYRTVYDPVGAGALSALIRKGAPYETAAAYATSHGFNPPDPKGYAAAVTFAQNHHGATNVEADKTVPTTLGERLSSSPAAAFTAGAATGASAGLDDVLGRSILGDQWDANRAALSATHGTADLLGNLAGGTGAMVGGGSLAQALAKAGAKSGVARNLLAFSLRNPVKAAALGDAAYGGVYGASENPDNPLAGATTGLVTAPLASVGGSAATKVLGGAIRGVADPAVQRLRALGIPLTVGEVLGGGAKKAQDAVTSVFGPGNMIARRYVDGRRALNEVGYNQAGDVIGAPINNVGQPAINALDAAKSRAYSTALDPVELNLNTPETVANVQGAINSAKAIPDVKEAQGLALGGLKTYIGDAAPDGVMNGRSFQEGYRGLSRLANQPDTQPFGYEIGQSLGQGRDALTSALEAQNPGAYAGFKNANQANRMLNILARAHNAAKNQITDGGEVLWTPAQLGAASTANAIKYGSPIAAAGGNRPFNQLINDSQKVMSSKLPDSGSASRLLGASILTGSALGGGGLGYGADGTEGAAEGAAIPLITSTLLGTKLGQQLLVAALIKRNATLRRSGQAIIDNPGYLAAAGTAAEVPYSTAP